MANYSRSNFSITETSAVVAVASTSNSISVGSTTSMTLVPTLYSIGLGGGVPGQRGNAPATDLSINKSTRPGWLTGRRPGKGQMWPRGVYNR